MQPGITGVPAPDPMAELRGRLRAKDHAAIQRDCQPGNELLALIGDRWTVLAVVMLSGGAKRFAELRRMMAGVSQRMLTRTLRRMERDGLVGRTVHPTVPPQVEYRLTELGESLRGPVVALGEWAHSNRALVLAARERFDRADAARAELPRSELPPGEPR